MPVRGIPGPEGGPKVVQKQVLRVTSVLRLIKGVLWPGYPPAIQSFNVLDQRRLTREVTFLEES